jgi:hypothetical protein
MRYSTINQEQSIALNLNYASKNFALTLVSFNDFGDLKMGKKKITRKIFLRTPILCCNKQCGSVGCE